ncbi:MAG: alpha-ketoacid dehydrogenase subunit beta [Nitrososphaerota archaeon]|nr:alpha-ketoacid dehydrogenase subunit beta [Nitrososphaerota archaeon]
MNNETLIQAARNSLAEAMKADSGVMALGEDVASGGPFGLTKGLSTEFGTDRVRNTPISEASFVGVGIGLALGGAHPLVDVMFNDFLTLASDQLFNQAAKIHFMSGGRYSVPLAIWTVGGAGTRWGAQHSQRFDGWLSQIPGLKVVSPSSPEMMRNTMREALGDPDPVVILVDRTLLYAQVGLPGDDGSPWEARIISEGERVTVAASGRLAHMALKFAHTRPGEIEVIDLQRLAPLDVTTVCKSVEKTGRLVLLNDEVSTGGFIASLALAVYDRAYWLLDAPIGHLTSPPTPVPAAPSLEDAYMITSSDIERVVLETLNR